MIVSQKKILVVLAVFRHVIDPLQRPAPLVTVATSDMPHITFLFTRSKEKTDNAPTDKIEQVTSSMKHSLSFQILSYFLRN